MVKLPPVEHPLVLLNKTSRHPFHITDAERPRRQKFKSVIHYGPSRQEVFEHYLVDPEVKVECNLEVQVPLQQKYVKDRRPVFRRRLSSLKQDIKDTYLQTAVNIDIEAEVKLERQNSLEDLQRSLGKSTFCALSRLSEDDVEPIEKFKRCVEKVVWIQRFVGTGRENGKRDIKDWKLMSWTLVYDDLGLTKRSYADLGLSFDPTEFKMKREHHISTEAKEILCMNPADRTEEQLHIAQLSLDQAVDAFNEFPIKMQKSLVKAGWYEQFEAGRVIIRQGHTADNFYMILSGTAVVTILATKDSGEVYTFTANILEKGYCFGELALINQAKRSATVTCRDDVELLALGREDYLDLFTKAERGKDPEHIRFLKTLHILRDWPVDKIPHGNPEVCIFIYVRRDTVLCKESNSGEWVYVIMTGTCRVLKNLHDTKPTLTRVGNQSLTSPRTKTPTPRNTPTPRVKSPAVMPDPTPTTEDQPAPRQRRRGVVTLKAAHFERSRATDDQDVEGEPVVIQQKSEHQRKLDREYRRQHGRLTKKQHRKILEAVFDERTILPPIGSETPRTSSRTSSRRQFDIQNKPQVFIEIAKLGPGDIFGLEQVIMAGIKETTNCSLVSDGAECILINRKFFRKHLSEDLAKRMRTEIQPFPSEDTLQRKLQTQTNWDAFRQMTVDDQVSYNRHLHNALPKY
ncbi:cyclic nucleotide-binding domain-containing protein 2-like [Haliotis asinina]|uniref:cyclic nucleotide-binding domain-containing protein 2-like n=1 Tax=Haliotis asinina TaxID=109174 RepID=UPI00353194DF